MTIVWCSILPARLSWAKVHRNIEKLHGYQLGSRETTFSQIMEFRKEQSSSRTSEARFLLPEEVMSCLTGRRDKWLSGVAISVPKCMLVSRLLRITRTCYTFHSPCWHPGSLNGSCLSPPTILNSIQLRTIPPPVSPSPYIQGISVVLSLTPSSLCQQSLSLLPTSPFIVKFIQSPGHIQFIPLHFHSGSFQMPLAVLSPSSLQ